MGIVGQLSSSFLYLSVQFQRLPSATEVAFVSLGVSLSFLADSVTYSVVKRDVEVNILGNELMSSFYIYYIIGLYIYAVVEAILGSIGLKDLLLKYKIHTK